MTNFTETAKKIALEIIEEIKQGGSDDLSEMLLSVKSHAYEINNKHDEELSGEVLSEIFRLCSIKLTATDK